MATTCRLFSYAGVIAMPLAANNQLSTNGAFVLQQPSLASSNITAGNVAQSTTTALSPANTKLLRIEVQKGGVVHYEISRSNSTPAVATLNSPTVEGHDTFDFGPGYTISILEAGTEA